MSVFADVGRLSVCVKINFSIEITSSGLGEHPVGAEWMGAGHAKFVEELPAEGGLQWRGEGSPLGLKVEGGTEAVELGVAGAIGGNAFHLQQIEVIEAVLLGELAPVFSGGSRMRQV